MDDATSDLSLKPVAATGTRRAVLGLTAGGLVQATGGWHLPAQVAEAAEPPVEAEHRANRRRHRRRKHRRRHHNARIVAAASLGLAQPVAMSSDQLTPIRLDQVTMMLQFSMRDGFVSPFKTATYTTELFLTWSLSGSGNAACKIGIRIINGPGEASDVVESFLLTQPITVTSMSLSQIIAEGDTIQVIGSVTPQDPGAELQIVSGAMSVYDLET